MQTSTTWLWLYAMLGLVTCYWAFIATKENYGQTMYWRGRKDGYDMHRRMTDSKIDADNN
jgi:hypothetical protein